MIKVNVLMVIGYVLGGFLGSLINLPPSHASPLWPAAAVALAGILVYGKRVLPGLLLGAFLIQAYLGYNSEIPSSTSTILFISTVLGFSATLQGMVGAKLINRIIGSNNPLIDDKSILIFLGLGGPLSCTISASVGTFAHYQMGIVNTEDWAFDWLTWWLGDTLGVFIFTPLLLRFIGDPGRQWQIRSKLIALPLAILFLLIVALFQFGKHQEQKRITMLFNERANLLHNVLQNKFNRLIDVNRTLKTFFDNSTEITPANFQGFAHSINNGKSLQWIPRVTQQNRRYYQALLGPLNQLPPTTQQSETDYFPVAFIEPVEGNKHLLGMDVTTDPVAYQAIKNARDTGLTTVTEPIVSNQLPYQSSYVTLYSPIYSAQQDLESVEQRRHYLIGFVASVLSIDEEVNELIKNHKNLRLLITITSGDKILFGHNTTDISTLKLDFPELEKKLTLQAANSMWQVTYTTAPEFYINLLSWNLWWLLITAFLLTGLTVTGLLMLTGRTLQTQGIVKIRTQELEKQVAIRKKIIRQRNDHNRVLQAILSTLPLTDILKLIIKIAEQNHPESICSIFLIDESGQKLRHGASSSLPDFFIDAIEEMTIGFGKGSSGTAAFTGQRIIVEDIFQHRHWQGLTELAKKAEIASCWSEPILSSTEQVLGTFSVYHRKTYFPTLAILNDIKELAQLTSIAIEKKYSEEQIIHLAFFDALTNLPNRRLFSDRLEHALAKAIRYHTIGALLYLDLDHFKTLNDSLGHHIGDELLIQVATRLKECVRDEDSVARLGGDEFVVLLNCTEVSTKIMQQHALSMAERVQSSLQAPYHLKGYTHHITPSIGITLLPQPNITPGELLKQADTAMYHAKHRGRNTISFYDQEMQYRADQRLVLEKGLRIALKEQQFSLYYQPQLDSLGNLIGAEALLRWLHPENGMMSPVDFIPVAEETNLILAIGEWVMHEACKQLQKWPNLPHLAINICPKEFHQTQFDKNVINILAEYNINASRLMLEITEGIIIEDINDSITKMRALNSLGIDISIDDFGTGYSSLSYLKVLPLDQLKIDQSFVRDINSNDNSTVIVETIIDMAKHLGLFVIAEGVETAEQLAFLVERGCHGYQGYFFSKPLTEEEFTRRFM